MKLSFKQYYGIILLFFFCGNSFAQKISLIELHTMSANRNWETSNKYLLSKGWEYYNSSVGDDSQYNTITWSFQKSDFNDKKANGWVYIYSYDGLPNKIMYRFRKKEYYTGIKNQLLTNGYKQNDEEILDNRVIAKYSNANFFLELTYSREENDSDDETSGSFTAYEITVFKKGGVYDPNNGKKQDFGEDGNLHAEYFLKDGKINGPVKFFNTDGSIKRTTTMINSIENGTSTEYIYKDSTDIVIGNYKGNLINGKKNGKWLLNILKDDKETNLSYTNYTNDISNGEFRSVEGDSVVYGNYKNGLIDGKYRVYRDIQKTLFGGITETDTTKIAKTSIGYFSENKKTGLWKNYHLSGLLESEGNYLDSLKTGKWKYYYNKYTDENDIELEHSRKLYMVENYNLGKLHGESILYYEEEAVEVKCEDSNATDKCYNNIFLKILEKSNYKNGLLHGPYEISNDKNEIMFKGQYLEGEESGKWTVKNSSEVDSWRGQNIETGIYQKGKKQGKWERYDEKHQIVETYTYKDDLLDGEQVTYIENVPLIKRTFKEGQFNMMTLYDSLGVKRKNYELYEILGQRFKCKATTYDTDTISIRSYKVNLEIDKIINPAFFHPDFKELSEKEKVLDGFYQTKTGDKILIEGNYENNIKNGTWSTFYYDQNVKTEFDYAKDGSIQREYYFDLKKNEPFSGEFIYKADDSDITEERSIKEGSRNGTTRFKDANNKTIKKESYKDGVLKV